MLKMMQLTDVHLSQLTSIYDNVLFDDGTSTWDGASTWDGGSEWGWGDEESTAEDNEWWDEWWDAEKEWQGDGANYNVEPNEDGTFNSNTHRREYAVFMRRLGAKKTKKISKDLATKYADKASRGLLFQEFMEHGMDVGALVVTYKRRTTMHNYMTRLAIRGHDVHLLR